MRLVIQLKPAAARAIRELRFEDETIKEVIEAVRQVGGTLEPMHPDADSEELASYFSMAAENAQVAEQIVERLQRLKAVNTAYLKPPETMP